MAQAMKRIPDVVLPFIVNSSDSSNSQVAGINILLISLEKATLALPYTNYAM